MKSKNTNLQAIRTMGVIAGRAKRGISGLWSTIGQTRSKLGISLLSREDIYRIIAEQSSQMNPEDHTLTLQAYDRRLKAMSEAMHALQEKIAELQASGHLNAQTMSQAIGEIEDDNHFSLDEKNILATILKQNIVLQKPELAGKAAATEIES
ncbi:MAG: hypothetical protein HQL17_02770 [Candidatus Omnitrophica bacterium]|nr:hypothetical protein [Candidatus Omnitrophota bacterium]